MPSSRFPWTRCAYAAIAPALLVVLGIAISGCDEDPEFEVENYNSNIIAPANVTATKGGVFNAVVLSWEPSPGVDGYQIYRGRGIAQNDELELVMTINDPNPFDNFPPTFVEDTPPTCGTTEVYTYRVASFIGNEFGRFSVPTLGWCSPTEFTLGGMFTSRDFSDFGVDQPLATDESPSDIFPDELPSDVFDTWLLYRYDVSVTGARGGDVRVRIQYNDLQGNPRPSPDAEFADENGNIAVFETLAVSVDDERFPGEIAAIPLRQLHLPEGQQRVNVEGFLEYRPFGSSDWQVLASDFASELITIEPEFANPPTP